MAGRTTARGRVIVRTRAEDFLKPGELKAAFAGVTEDTPIWRAVMQLLDDQIQNAQCQVSSPDMADKPGAMTHTAGGLEWLQQFQADLLASYEDAHKKLTEEDED